MAAVGPAAETPVWGMGRRDVPSLRPIPAMSVMPCITTALRKRVESFGLINFPQRNGAKLYGELTVRIPVYRDGTLFEKEGGPGIERSSGNPALDRAALNIIRRAAPFGPFPKSMQAKNGGADVWIIITKLRFTRDQGVQSQIRSTVR